MQRETTTIMFADVVESVRLIELDEFEAIVRVRSLMTHLANRVAPLHDGAVMETRGDGIFIRFASARAALRCAFAIHAAARNQPSSRSTDAVLRFRIGLHTADVFTDHESVFGSGVSVAARIAALAGPGETVTSSDTRDYLVAGVDADIVDIGDCFLKHIASPIRAFRVSELGTEVSVSSSEQPPPNEQVKSRLAIIPFKNANAQASAGSLGDLIAQSVIHAASHSGTIDVIAWLSCKAFGDRDLSATEIGSALKADWILTGSCFLSDQGLLVQAELINVASNTIELSDRIFDGVGDLLAADSNIAARLASATTEHLAKVAAKRIVKHPLPTLKSHSLLVGAITLMHRSGPRAFLRSKDALEHLLERHPRMHAARPWLAKWYVLCTTRGLCNDVRESASRAIEQTSRALDARPDDAFALAVQGFVHFHLKHDIDNAAGQLESALQINPNDTLALIFSAAVLSAKSEKEKAWARAEHAISLSPFDPFRAYMRMIAAGCAITSEKFDRAAQLARDSIRESSSHAASWRTLIIALIGTGEIEAAKTACENLMKLEPELTLSAYKSRLSLPKEQTQRAIDALRTAGVPMQ